MSKRKPLSLPGDRVAAPFEAAALILSQRFATSTKSKGGLAYQAIAAGLTPEFNHEVGPENILVTGSMQAALVCTAIHLDRICAQIKNAPKPEGLAEAEFVFLVRGPIDKTIYGNLRSFANAFKIETIYPYDLNDDGFGEMSADIFSQLLKETLELEPNLRDFPQPRKSKKFQFVLGYLDASPTMGEGRIRKRAETMMLAGIFDQIEKKNKDYIRSISLSFPSRTLNHPFLAVELRKQSEFETGHHFYSFSQISTKWRQKTHAIYDVAHYGLGDHKGCVMVGPKADIAYMRKEFGGLQYEPPRSSLLACDFMFGAGESDQDVRTAFTRHLAESHAVTTLTGFAILNGKARDFLSSREYERALGWLEKFGRMAKEDAIDLLENGVDGFKVLNLPEAGQDLIVDFQGLLNWDETTVPSGQSPDRELDLDDVINLVKTIAKTRLNLEIGDCSQLGLEGASTLFLLSAGTSPSSLIERLLRLKRLSDLVQSSQPFLPVHKVESAPLWDQRETLVFTLPERPLPEGMTKVVEDITSENPTPK